MLTIKAALFPQAILGPQDKFSRQFCHVCPKWAEERSQTRGKYNEFMSADHTASSREWKLQIGARVFDAYLNFFHLKLFSSSSFQNAFWIQMSYGIFFPPQTEWMLQASQLTHLRSSIWWSEKLCTVKLEIQYPVSNTGQESRCQTKHTDRVSSSWEYFSRICFQPPAIQVSWAGGGVLHRRVLVDISPTHMPKPFWMSKFSATITSRSFHNYTRDIKSVSLWAYCKVSSDIP